MALNHVIFKKPGIFKISRFSKSCDFQKHKKRWGRPLVPYRRFVLDRIKFLATTLIPPGQLKAVRTIGSSHLRYLSGQEAHDFLVEQNFTLVENGLSNRTKSTERVGT